MLETTQNTINQGFGETCEYCQIVGTLRAIAPSATTAISVDESMSSRI
jgi:hypothetical protein